MRKIINGTDIVITGTALAFAGLVLTAQAIPIAIYNNFPRLLNTDSLITDHSGENSYANGSGSLGNYFTSPISILSSDHDSWLWQLAPQNPVLILSTITSTAETPAPTNVPDGGTTVLMLGGVFFGLVILRKNSEQKQADQQLKIWLPRKC